VTPAKLIVSLNRSGDAISRMLERALAGGGTLPAVIPYRNIPQDAAHFFAYLVAHEGHHRGQIAMLARQLGHRLPSEVTGGLWQWSKRAKEASGSG
jgi:uncharacterized damage-inducible protein DinB